MKGFPNKCEYFCEYKLRVGERPSNSLKQVRTLSDITQRNVIYNSIFISFKTVCMRIKNYKKRGYVSYFNI